MIEKENSLFAILSTATELFAEKGFKATTIRDISKTSGFNSSLISYHFGSKEGLLKSIILDFFNENLEDLFEVLLIEVSSKEELRITLAIFIDQTLSLGLQNWKILKIITSETYELSKFEELNQMNLSSLNKLHLFFKRAKRKGIIHKEIDTQLLSDNIFAVLMDQMINYPLKKNLEGLDLLDKKTKTKWINKTLDLYFLGIVS